MTRAGFVHPWWENYGWAALSLTLGYLWYAFSAVGRGDVLQVIKLASMVAAVGALNALTRNRLLNAGVW